jgi:hypothetical protein
MSVHLTATSPPGNRHARHSGRWSCHTMPWGNAAARPKESRTNPPITVDTARARRLITTAPAVPGTAPKRVLKSTGRERAQVTTTEVTQRKPTTANGANCMMGTRSSGANATVRAGPAPAPGFSSRGSVFASASGSARSTASTGTADWNSAPQCSQRCGTPGSAEVGLSHIGQATANACSPRSKETSRDCSNSAALASFDKLPDLWNQF